MLLLCLVFSVLFSIYLELSPRTTSISVLFPSLALSFPPLSLSTSLSLRCSHSLLLSSFLIIPSFLVIYQTVGEWRQTVSGIGKKRTSQGGTPLFYQSRTPLLLRVVDEVREGKLTRGQSKNKRETRKMERLCQTENERGP